MDARWVVAGALLIAAASGCQLWLDVDHAQCDSDAACIDLLGSGATCGEGGVCSMPSQLGMTADSVRALPSRWSCASTPADAVTADTARMLRVRMDVVDVTTLRLPQGLSGVACNWSDGECTRPVSHGIAPGDDGFIEVELPYGFQGYFSLMAPGYLPALAYHNRPYTEPTSLRGPPMLTASVLDAIAAAVGGGANDASSRGVALLDIRDCNDTAGDGVRFVEVDGHAASYFKGALPAPDLTQTAISNQLSPGREPRALAVFLDLEPGPTTFRAVLPDSGEAVSRVTVEIRAGHVTYVRIRAGY